MRSFTSLAALALASTVLASDVHDLKADTFKDFVNTNSLALIEFFAPWYVEKSRKMVIWHSGLRNFFSNLHNTLLTTFKVRAL